MGVQGAAALPVRDGCKKVWMLVTQGRAWAGTWICVGAALVARADMSSPAFLFSVILPG